MESSERPSPRQGEVSASEGEPSPDTATEMLLQHETIRSHAENRGPSRAFAHLTVWHAVALSAYVTAFLYVMGDPTVDRATAAPAGSFTSASMLLIPFLTHGSLVGGARERFEVRRGTARWYWAIYGLVIAGIIALSILIFVGVHLAWWVRPLAAILAFAAFAGPPLRQLRQAPAQHSERWVNAPLSHPVRWTTSAVGFVIGVITATSLQPWFSFVAMAALLLLVVGVAGWSTSWGLARAGYEWGPVHWIVFGTSMTVMFAMAVLLWRTGWITDTVSIGTGVAVSIAMIVVSFLPVRPQRA